MRWVSVRTRGDKVEESTFVALSDKKKKKFNFCAMQRTPWLTHVVAALLSVVVASDPGGHYQNSSKHASFFRLPR